MTRTSSPERAAGVVRKYGTVRVPAGTRGAATRPLFAFGPRSDAGRSTSGSARSEGLAPDLVLPRPSAA